MKTVETKSTTSSLVQAKKQPFFSKEGQDSFFSKTNNVNSSFFSPTTIQPKLIIGQPNDKYEVEADAMADKIVQRLSKSPIEGDRAIANCEPKHNGSEIQRKCSSCEEEELQEKEEGLSETSIELQRKPIFESNSERPDTDVQTKPISTPIIQAKCSSCEQEEKLQPKEENSINSISEKSISRIQKQDEDVPWFCGFGFVNDEIVQGLIDDAIQNHPNDISGAWGELNRRRNTAENCCEYNLAAAEHYLYARSIVSNGQSTYAEALIFVALYAIGKFVFIPLPGIDNVISTGVCPPTTYNPSVVNWGYKGAADGRDNPQSSVQRGITHPNVQPKTYNTSNILSENLESKLSLSKGSGSKLPLNIQTSMSSEFGADFSNVKIHSGNEAVQMSNDIGAQAFTHGSDIYFNEGKYNTNSASGKHLLAHELAHTVQQGASVQNKELPQIQKANTSGNENDTIETARFIVNDTDIPSSGQLTKTTFLNRLNRESCTVTDVAFVGTPFSTETCPYITRSFKKLKMFSPVKIEATLFRYDAQLEKAETLELFFETFKSRVQRGVAAWLENGDLSGVPEEMVNQIPDNIRIAVRVMGSLRSGINTVSSGISSAVSGIGSIFFKSKTGNSKPLQSSQNILNTVGEGSKIESGTRNKMEGAFGTSFSDVKIHSDNKAAQLSRDMDARAFTIGSHISFGNNEYKPGSLAGDALLAHELAHVQQQKGSGPDTIMEKGSNSQESLLEEQADDQAVSTVLQIWSKSNEQEIEIPKAKMPEMKSGLKLQRCGGEPAPRWSGVVSELKIDLYSTNGVSETPVDPGEAITRDFPSFVAQLNYHAHDYPRVIVYNLMDQNHENPVGPRIPSRSSQVSRIPMPPIGEYTLEASVRTGISSMPHITLRRPINIIESYKTLSETQATSDLADQEGRTVASELLNYEQFSSIIRQNAVSVAGISQELIDAWNTAQAQAIIIEASINQSISGGQNTEAKSALRGFYNQLRTTVSSNDVFHPVEYVTYDVPGGGMRTDHIPAYTTNQYITAATNESNVGALNGGVSAENWRNYLDKFYQVTAILNRYISDKLRADGFTDSARQLTVSGAYNSHLRKLYRDHPDAQPVRAVFYPMLQANLHNDAEDGETPHYNLTALPQKMYTYRTDDGVWHLLDITRHNKAFNTEESGGTTRVPPRTLITELDSAERFPEGMMHWNFQHGSADKCEMTHPWSASEVLNLISMVLAVAGIAALVAASGGTLAPLVPTLIFVASGLAGAASAVAHMQESSELGTITSQSFAADAFGIAASLFGAAAAGTGHIVKAAQASEAAWTGIRGLSAIGAQAIYRPVQIGGIFADFGSLIVFSSQASNQYDAIATMPDGEAKTLAQRRLVAMSLLTGGMTIISIRGGMHDVGAGRTLYLDLTTINGVRTPVAHRIMPQGDIIAHPRLGSARADVEAFLARTDLNETTFSRFRGELSVALNTAGMSEAEIRAFVRHMGTAAGVAEARTILTQFRNSRVAIAVGGVSRSAGYDLSYMHTSPQDFQTTVRGTFTQEGSVVHNGSMTHVEGADISNYTMRIDAADGARVEADVVVVYSDFTAGSAIGTGTVAPGASVGPARNAVVWNPTANRWTVRVEVDQRLAPRDIPRAVGHELDEAGDVINRLHGNQGPDVNQRIAELQRPGMFSGEPMTSHDLASLREINTLLTSASTSPSAANSLSVMLRDLGLTADSGLFQARLTRVLSSGQISSNRIVLFEAWSTYDIAIARNSRVRRFTREEFIAEYQRGRRFDEGGNNRWYNLNTDRSNTRQFFTDAEIADPNLAFNRLTGTNSRSSFKSYYEMLTSNGIASEASVRTRFNELLAGTRGRDLDFVRHSLKDSFKNDIMTYLTNRQRLTTAHPGTTFEEASHVEMMRITNDLNSSDKGSLSERWYAALHDPDSLTHVRFTGASGRTRFADLLNEDGTIKDLKNIRGSLTASELEQFDDYRLMIGRDVAIANPDGSTSTISVQRLEYSFMNPSGVRANAEWMHGILSSPSTNITFEIFNAHGQRRIVTRSGIFEVGLNNRSVRVGAVDLLTNTAQLRLWLNL